MVLRLKGSEAFRPAESAAGGLLLQGHPRPWPVAKPRTLRVPAHKVPYVRRLSVLLWMLLARAFGGELRALPPPALRTGQRRRLPLALLTTDLLPCPALRAGSLRSKVSRGAACCQYNCSSRLSGEPVSPLPQYTTLLWSLRALDYCRTFRQLFEAVKKTVSNQG